VLRRLVAPRVRNQGPPPPPLKPNQKPPFVLPRLKLRPRKEPQTYKLKRFVTQLRLRRQVFLPPVALSKVRLPVLLARSHKPSWANLIKRLLQGVLMMRPELL
jgi:hypothetical protein